ncbi:MAG TPA: TssQ family T6SS-associated lipoprotein [Burkholderiaceae bacterium]|nr:TssQ family T6SS-associated lipoprotein [Burkholderiaceae bacterium]
MFPTVHSPASTRRSSRALLAAFVAAMLSACASKPPVPKPEPTAVAAPAPAPAAPAPAPAPPPPTPEQERRAALTKIVDEAVAAYDRGDFRGALARLNGAPDLQRADTDIQVRALKYMAFSNCAQGQRAPCRAAFERALTLDASFDLTPAEQGHPIWGPEFKAAKAAVKR